MRRLCSTHLPPKSSICTTVRRHVLYISLTFVFTVYQTDKYDELANNLRSQNIECHFVKGSTISESDLPQIACSDGRQCLVVIDDGSMEVAQSKELAHCFTVARHHSCSILVLLHFLYTPNFQPMRVISANTTYFVLLKSSRLLSQVATLGSQLQIRKELLAAYRDQCAKDYGYLLVDLHTTTPDKLRLRTDLLNEHQTVYVPI